MAVLLAQYQRCCHSISAGATVLHSAGSAFIALGGAGAVLTSACIPPNRDRSEMDDWEQTLLHIDFSFVLIFTLEALLYCIAIG